MVGGDEVPGGRDYNHMRQIAHSLTNDHVQVQEMARMFNQRYEESEQVMAEYAEEGDSRTPVAQEARQPSTRDPKLWLVKCVVSRFPVWLFKFLGWFREKNSHLFVAKSIDAKRTRNSFANYLSSCSRSLERIYICRGI